MSQTSLWALFGALVAGILLFDLFVLGRRKRALGTKLALIVVGAYAAIAAGFGIAVYLSLGRDRALEFYTAYLLEQSLSFDNILVWLLIFENLEIPERAEQKVLFWGIIGAMLFRGIFIFTGAALIREFTWLLYLFGALVIFSGIKLLTSGGRHDISNSRVLRFARKFLPLGKDSSHRRFFKHEDNQLKATPLFLALVVIETTDLVFALDSIPAIFGVTDDPLIVYTSNIFAIVGLRALYFAIAGLLEQLRYLRFGLGLLLVVIGLKMVGSDVLAIPIGIMLALTVSIIGGTTAASLWARKRQTAGRG